MEAGLGIVLRAKYRRLLQPGSGARIAEPLAYERSPTFHVPTRRMAPDILTRIPVELIFHIISFLHGNKPALSACSLCCSALAAVARPLLFHTLRTGLDFKAAGRFESLLESAPGVVPLIKRIDVWVPALEPATHQFAMIAISRIMLHPRVEETPPALGLTMWPVVPGSRRFGTTVPAHLDQWVTSLELNRLDFPPELHFWDFVLAFPKLESLTLGSVKVGERFQAIPSLKPKISHITFKQGTWDRISDVYSFLVHYTPPLPSLVSLDMRFPGVLGRLSIQFGEQYGPGVKNLRFGAVVTRDLQGDWGNSEFRVIRPAEYATLIVPV